MVQINQSEIVRDTSKVHHKIQHFRQAQNNAALICRFLDKKTKRMHRTKKQTPSENILKERTQKQNIISTQDFTICARKVCKPGQRMLTTKMLPVLVFLFKKTPTNHMPYPGYVLRVVPFSGVLPDPHFWLTHVELIVMALVGYFISKNCTYGI